MILDQFTLTGKVAIVTGCSTGLGEGMAIGLAEAGADVVGIDYMAGPYQAQAVIEGLDRKFLEIPADLSSLKPIPGIIEKAVATFGRIDILVNNAGIIRREDAINFTEKDWDDVMNLNVKTVFFFSQAAARQFIKQGTGGKIINMASMLSFQGGIRVASYAAAKSGMAGITRLMANELASKGLNINAIAPGYMATDNTAALRVDPKRAPAILDRIPAGRWGEPADLMGAVVFLASAASEYMNGAIVPVDGGWLTR